MTSITSTLKFLYGLELFGIKVGLRNIRSLSKFLGYPERRYPIVHIAGTNGKGSTASMIAAMLTAAGYRTGLYTSPHLLSFTERIRIDGRPISEGALQDYTRTIKPEVVRLKATFFEATTAIAFQYFADEEVDIAVIETGLGGRLDATNIVQPVLSIITTIGFDHTEYLGNTLQAIGREKGGIIKRGVPCLTGANDPATLRTLRMIARKRHSSLLELNQLATAAIRESTLTGLILDIRFPDKKYPRLFCGLAGTYQVQNAMLALAAVELLRKELGFAALTEPAIRNGLAGIRRFAGLRGRSEVVLADPLVLADVAHNPDGTSALTRSIEELIGRKCVLVFGVMQDKEWPQMIHRLAPWVRLAICVQPQIQRALGVDPLQRMFQDCAIPTIAGGLVSSGVEWAFQERRESEPILITGSHYVVAEALKFLNWQ